MSRAAIASFMLVLVLGCNSDDECAGSECDRTDAAADAGSDAAPPSDSGTDASESDASADSSADTHDTGTGIVITSVTFGDGSVDKDFEWPPTSFRVEVVGENLPVDGMGIAFFGDIADITPNFRGGPSSDTLTVVRARIADLAPGSYTFGVEILGVRTDTLTFDILEPPACSVDPDCDDGLACNGTETCGADGCVAGTPLTCSDDDVCTTDGCDDAMGCVFTPLGASCLGDADDVAAFRLLVQSRRTQLVRPRMGMRPFKWAVFTHMTQLLPSGMVDYATAGEGDTIAAAVADAEAKLGQNFGPPGNLTPSQRESIQWYSDMVADGPTSLRRDNAGTYHADIYRMRLGVVVGGPFATIEETVAYMQSLGL